MLIDAFGFFSASVLLALSGELPPLCDLPWEFNSGCDHSSADKTRARMQQSASQGVGWFVGDFLLFFFFTVKDSLRCQVKGREAERSSLLLHYKPTHLSSHKCSSFFHLSNDGICFKQKSRSVFLGIINEFYSCMELKHQRVIHQAKMSTSLWF